MKKALFSMIFLCSFLSILAQNQVPIPDSYLTSPPISLCKKMLVLEYETWTFLL
ncbi:MAG: hypothetical protein IPP71_06465 [Bacteroidetes bacterium]|nr:hypothetical protein [Bacteroidota bacterium]